MRKKAVKKDPNLWRFTRKCGHKQESASGMIPCYLEDGPVALGDDGPAINALCVGCNRWRKNIDQETVQLRQQDSPP